MCDERLYRDSRRQRRLPTSCQTSNEPETEGKMLHFLRCLSLPTPYPPPAYPSGAYDRWVNLWISVPTEEILPESCEAEDDNETDSSVGRSVYIGNTLLTFGILLGIFTFHILVISAVEAYWLAEVRDQNAAVNVCRVP